MREKIELKRSLGWVVLTFYGLGTIIGAGVYVLIGEIAAVADIFLPFSFLLAGIIAIFTALSYTELATRFPVSAGEAVYIEEAWAWHRLSAFVGWMIVLTGTVSAAAIANGFVGYINVLLDVERHWAIVVLVLVLTMIAIWGMQASANTIFLLTLVELGGLFYVVFAASNVETVTGLNELFYRPSWQHINGVVLGSFLAFYAFIGFEDMVNIVEEVKDPRRNFPIAIILAVILSTIIYCAVGFSAVRIMSPDQLAKSAAPLADIIVAAGGDPKIIGLISLFAVVNGGLVQIIMGSRVLYGMANKGMAPARFGIVSEFTKTPVYATLLVAIGVLFFSLLLPLAQLARLTSLIMLSVFIIVNIALIVIKRKGDSIVSLKGVRVPIWVPVGGALTSMVLVIYQLISFYL